MMLVGGNVYGAPAPETVAAPARVVAEVVLPKPIFVPETTIATTTTTTIRRSESSSTTTTTTTTAPSDLVPFLPAPDVNHVETWIPSEPPSALETSLAAALDPQKLSEVDLSLVGIVPSTASDKRPRAQSEQSEPKFAYIFLTRGDGCAVAFAASEANKDERGVYLIFPIFFGKLPLVNNPNYYDTQAMFQGEEIKQAESAEKWINPIDDLPAQAISTQKLCDRYFSDQAGAES